MTRRELSTASPILVVGVLGVLAGGLLSAATASAPTRHIAWAVAYLVLVVGVAQLCLGAGQALLAERPPRWSVTIAELVLFNLGNAGVLIGTVLEMPWLVDVGGIALIVALVYFMLGARGSAGLKLLRYCYWFVVVVLLVSIPTGLVLARVLN
ncbi:hypothetical protein [Antricoccus suffuscus]|uniref:hypothetical protein n=1 Tax=Antricoccus suffuscus TaxID=1629062 RepID=UPI0011B2848C|nr:hypothetical protein [Antricoccus suffuscus]